MTRKWKRSDITDEMVCRAYLPQMERRAKEHEQDLNLSLGDILDRAFRACTEPQEEPEFADGVLQRETGAPCKVIYAAMKRAGDRDLIEWGVTMRSGWLTEKGKELLGHDRR